MVEIIMVLGCLYMEIIIFVLNLENEIGFGLFVYCIDVNVGYVGC